MHFQTAQHNSACTSVLSRGLPYTGDVKQEVTRSNCIAMYAKVWCKGGH